MPVVLQLTDKGPGAGGIRRIVEAHAEILHQQGFVPSRLRLLSSSAQGDGSEPSLPVRVGWGGEPDKTERSDFRYALSGADAIHLHLGFLSLAPWHVEAAASAAPLLTFLHDVSPFPAAPVLSATGRSNWPGRVAIMSRLRAGTRRALWQAIVRHSAALVVPSQYLGELATKAGADRVVHLPHPLTPRACAPLVAQPVLFYSGRLAPEKGALILIEAFARVATPGASLEVVGAGPAFAAMKRRVGKLNLTGRVRFHGQLPHDEVFRHLTCARAVLHPSLVPEGLGLSGIEAMQAGRPVAGFGLGGVSDWLIDGQTGLIARPGDAESLAAAADRLLGEAGLAERLGRAAQAHVTSHFGRDFVARELVRLTSLLLEPAL